MVEEVKSESLTIISKTAFVKDLRTNFRLFFQITDLDFLIVCDYVIKGTLLPVIYTYEFYLPVVKNPLFYSFAASFTKYCFHRSKIKSIYPHSRVISSLCIFFTIYLPDILS